MSGMGLLHGRRTTSALHPRGKTSSGPGTSYKTAQKTGAPFPLTIDFTPVPPYVPLAVSGDIQTLLGYAPGEVIGNPHFLMNAVHPEDLPQLISGLFHLFLRGCHIYEYRFLRKNGSYVRMLAEIHLIRSRSGRPLKISCALKAPVFTVGEMLGHRTAGDVVLPPQRAGDVELTIDCLYRIRTASSSIEKLLGYRQSGLIGLTIRELIPPDYQTTVHAVLVRIMECCQDKVHFWTAAKHRDGSLRFIACELRGGFDGQGNRMIAASCHDICSLISSPGPAGPPEELARPRGAWDAAPHEEPDPMASLTARERDILYLTVEGYSSTQIGKRLSISPRTVEAHRASLMRKLHVRTISQLIRVTVCRIAYPNQV
jgi:PAS domain S-box-containing protein